MTPHLPDLTIHARTSLDGVPWAYLTTRRGRRLWWRRDVVRAGTLCGVCGDWPGLWGGLWAYRCAQVPLRDTKWRVCAEHVEGV